MTIKYIEYTDKGEADLVEHHGDKVDCPQRLDRVVYSGFVYDVVSVVHYIEKPDLKRVFVKKLCKESEL